MFLFHKYIFVSQQVLINFKAFLVTILANEECFEHSFKAKDENEAKVALHVQRIYYPNYLAKRPLFIIGILCARGSGAALICLGPHWQFRES